MSEVLDIKQAFQLWLEQGGDAVALLDAAEDVVLAQRLGCNPAAAIYKLGTIVFD